MMRGLGNRPDIYFQGNVANLKYHLELPKLLDETFYEIELLTGRKYNPFMWYGPSNAKRAIVAMGSSTLSIKDVVN